MVETLKRVIPFSKEIASFLVNTHTFYPLILLIASLFLHRLTRRILLFIKKRIISSSLTKELRVGQYIFRKLKLERLSLLVYVASFWLLRNYFLQVNFLNVSETFSTLSTLTVIYILTRFLHEILDGLAVYTESREEFRGRSYRSYIQVLILIV